MYVHAQIHKYMKYEYCDKFIRRKKKYYIIRSAYIFVSLLIHGIHSCFILVLVNDDCGVFVGKNVL